MFNKHQPGLGSGHQLSTSRPPPAGNGYPGWRTPSFDNTTYILILLVVFVPVIFTSILCTITYCVYRYNKKRSEQAPTNAPIVAVDRSGAPVATVIYNTQHRPFAFEESPPSYDSLPDVKKDPHSVTTSTHEQFQLTVLPSTTSPSMHEEATSAPIHSSSPTQAPPSYINLSQ